MHVIIGGSGFYNFLQDPITKTVDTPFGQVQYDHGEIEGNEVAFIPRHGKGHSLTPSQINYRANIFAAHMLDARAILTTNAVGSLHKDIPPGTLAVPDQIIDFTHGRPSTFFDGSGFSITTNKGRELSGVVHTDVTHPYDRDIRGSYLAAANTLDLTLYDGGTMIAFNGPRYETKAEIEAFRRLGGDFAGMTTAPETFLAKEIDLPYATIAVITNYAAGMQASVSHDEVEEVFGQNIATIKSLFRTIITAQD